jgi:hypothetical protein
MLFYIASVATGEIFAENLCGEGSARRWAESRGLTFDSLESEEEMAMQNERIANAVAELESKRSVAHLLEVDGVSGPVAGNAFIDREVARQRERLNDRILYVKECYCPTYEVWAGNKYYTTYDFAN